MKIAVSSTLSRAVLPFALAIAAAFAFVTLSPNHHNASAQTRPSMERRAMLGVRLDDVGDRRIRGFDRDRGGAYVVEVVEGSPADRADIREGDVIVEFDGETVSSAADLTRRVRRIDRDRTVSLRLWRDGREIDADGIRLSDDVDLRDRDDVRDRDRDGDGVRDREDSRRVRDRERDLSALQRVDQLESQIDRLEREVRDLRTRLERVESLQRSRR
jgi:hypothetical protein